MMDRICLSLTLPLLLGAVQAELPANWKAVEFKEGRFSVLLPPDFTEKKQRVTTAGEPLEVTTVIGERGNGSLFVVSFCDYSDADIKKGPIEKRLEFARDGAAASAGGVVRGETKCQIDGYPGRDFAIAKESEIVVRTRIYLVKNRLYQVMTLGKASAKESTAFLDSFRLIK